MNHANWNVDHAQRTSGRVKVVMPRMTSPKTFDEPILKQLKREKQMAERGDGTLPIKTSWKKVLEEDERQLDLLQGKRGHIFKASRHSVQPAAKKKLLPSTMAHNTNAMLSPHRRNSNTQFDKENNHQGGSYEAVINLEASQHKPVHEKAQIQ